MVLTAIDRHRVRRGRASIGGRVAGGVPVLLLTTIGRRTGRPRTTPLLYTPNETDTLLLIAANGAADWRPEWLLNLEHTPSVTVEVDGRQVQGVARVLSGAERLRRWAEATAAFPGLAEAQRVARRQIDVVEVHLDRP